MRRARSAASAWTRGGGAAAATIGLRSSSDSGPRAAATSGALFFLDARGRASRAPSSRRARSLSLSEGAVRKIRTLPDADATVSVKNVPYDVLEAELKELFSKVLSQPPRVFFSSRVQERAVHIPNSSQPRSLTTTTKKGESGLPDGLQSSLSVSLSSESVSLSLCLCL